MTKDEAQRRRWTFYEAVKIFIGLEPTLGGLPGIDIPADFGGPGLSYHCFEMISRKNRQKAGRPQEHK